MTLTQDSGPIVADKDSQLFLSGATTICAAVGKRLITMAHKRFHMDILTMVAYGG